MILNNETNKQLVKEFAKTVLSKEKTTNNTEIYYATAIYPDTIQLDGSSTTLNVEFSRSVYFKAGDRLIVMINRHRAIVLGNLTNPALIRGID